MVIWIGLELYVTIMSHLNDSSFANMMSFVLALLNQMAALLFQKKTFVSAGPSHVVAQSRTQTVHTVQKVMKQMSTKIVMATVGSIQKLNHASKEKIFCPKKRVVVAMRSTRMANTQ